MPLNIDFKQQSQIKKKIFPVYYFLASYPSTTIMMVFLLILAGLAEGIGIAALLPLINLATQSEMKSDSFIGNIVNEGLAFVGIEPTIGNILLIIVLLIFAKASLIFWALRSVGYVGARVLADLRNTLTQALANARWSYFIQQKTGDITTAVGVELEGAANIYPATGQLLAGAIQVLVYAIISLTISIPLTIAAIVLGVVMMRALRGLVKMARRASEKHTEVQRSFMSLLVDCLGNMKALKAMGRQNRFIDLLQKDIEQLYQVRKKNIISGIALKTLQEPIQVLAIALGLFFLLQYWTQRLESLFILVFLFYRMVQRFGFLQNYYQGIVSAIPSFWFVYETIDRTESQKEIGNGSISPSFKKEIKLDSVSFSYGEKQILNNLSLCIPAGHFVSLIGSSGSGKTTIADLVIGLNKLESGNIWIDHTDINDIDKHDWRQMIGYVPQETCLFHDSILKNVTFGDDSITEAQVVSALKRADAWKFVKNLPQGINESVGEHGSRLSGGQKQRIAIARALVRNPSLLLLDESTTALDPVTEREIILTLKKLKGELTILSISHQPAMKEAADIVYMLENSKVTSIASNTPEKSNQKLDSL